MPRRRTVEAGTSSSVPADENDLQQRCRSLIDRIAHRDETSLATLYDLTSSVVYGLSMKVLRDSRDAEESTLEVYQQVWAQADRYDRARGTPLGWLMTIARSRAIDRLRSSTRWTGAVLPLDTDVRDHGDGPLATLMSTERRDKVRRAVHLLTPAQRLALQTAYFGGLSQSETAQQLGVPLGTVKTRIRAAMVTLREQLRELERDL